MAEEKNIFATAFKKMHLGMSGNEAVAAYWRMIMTLSIIFFFCLLAGGWVLYTWAAAEGTSATIIKPIRAGITMDELKQVKSMTAERKEKFEQVLKENVQVVGLK